MYEFEVNLFLSFADAGNVIGKGVNRDAAEIVRGGSKAVK